MPDQLVDIKVYKSNVDITYYESAKALLIESDQHIYILAPKHILLDPSPVNAQGIAHTFFLENGFGEELVRFDTHLGGPPLDQAYRLSNDDSDTVLFRLSEYQDVGQLVSILNENNLAPFSLSQLNETAELPQLPVSIATKAITVGEIEAMIRHIDIRLETMRNVFSKMAEIRKQRDLERGDILDWMAEEVRKQNEDKSKGKESNI